jgi:hypothetical protein
MKEEIVPSRRIFAWLYTNQMIIKRRGGGGGRRRRRNNHSQRLTPVEKEKNEAKWRNGNPLLEEYCRINSVLLCRNGAYFWSSR